MATITTKTEKQSKHPCGFCSTGHHDTCPGGVLNGNLTEVYLCGCTEHPQVIRCLDCGHRSTHGDEFVSTETWTCLDVEDCQARVAKRREEAHRNLYGDGPSPEARKAREVKEARTTAPRAPKTGSCLCCGETTKGGLFLPGHDSRYLSHITRNIAGEEGTPHTLEEWIAKMQEYGCSDALQAKLVKRVTA